jgi:hypothetical protein
VEAYQAGTPEEKAIYGPLLRHKINNLSDRDRAKYRQYRDFKKQIEEDEAASHVGAIDKELLRRQFGGPIPPNQPVLVGEQQPELLLPQGQVVGAGGPQIIQSPQPGMIVPQVPLEQAQLTIPDPNTMLAHVLDQYPGLKRVHNMDTTSAMYASPERIAATQKAYGTEDIGGLEYWRKTEGGMPGLPHPTGGKGNVLEIYNQKMKNDPQELHTAILGDLIHGMPDDPGWAKMRNEFASSGSWSPEAKALIKRRQNLPEGDPRRCPPASEGAKNSMIDAFVRGALMPYKGGNWKDKNPELYSPKQLQVLDKMEEYLKTGEIREDRNITWPLSKEDQDYYRNHFNTPLSKAEEVQFQDWIGKASKVMGRNIQEDLDSYDLRGHWKENLRNKPITKEVIMGGPDKYKKPNYLYFGDESIYQGDKFQGGHWEEDAKTGAGIYTPSKQMMKDPERMKEIIKYFSKRGRDSILVIPSLKYDSREHYKIEPKSEDKANGQVQAINAELKRRNGE